jgi:hypothetical protein
MTAERKFWLNQFIHCGRVEPMFLYPFFIHIPLIHRRFYLSSEHQALFHGRENSYKNLTRKVTKVMSEVETSLQRNNLMINTGKTTAISVHSKQMRLPSRPKVTFKNLEIAY